MSAPDEAQLSSFYEENKQFFQAPEYREATLVALSVEELAASIVVDDPADPARAVVFIVGHRRQSTGDVADGLANDATGTVVFVAVADLGELDRIPSRLDGPAGFEDPAEVVGRDAGMRALSLSPPRAKIQLPQGEWCSTKKNNAARPIHQKTDD